jgi:hypothetical protein
VESLFQDDRGRIWVSTPRGVAYFENGRFIPVSGVPGGVVHSIAGDSAGNLWISHRIRVFFICLGGVWSNGFPGPGWDGRTWPDCSAPRSCAGRPVAWIFQGGVAYFKDGQVRASYAAPMGWARAVSTAFNSIGTVRSGPQPRAG